MWKYKIRLITKYNKYLHAEKQKQFLWDIKKNLIRILKRH